MTPLFAATDLWGTVGWLLVLLGLYRTTRFFARNSLARGIGWRVIKGLWK